MIRTVLFCLALLLTAATVTGQDQVLRPAAAHTITGGTDNAALLFDGKTETYVFPGWSPSFYPLRVQVDFPQTVTLSGLNLWDGSGKPVLRVFALTETGGQTKVSDVVLDKYLTWARLPVSVSARRFVLEIQDAQGDKPLGEVQFIGTVSGTTPPPPPPPPTDTTTTPPAPPVTDLTTARAVVGVNGFHWVPPGLIQPFSTYRIFSMWEWFEAEVGHFRFEPTTRGNGNYDTFLADLKRRGVRPILTLNTCPEWMRREYGADAGNALEYRPVKAGADPAKPESYREIARACWQITARYGTKTWPASALLVDTVSQWGGSWPANKKLSGLNLLYGLEVWNEPDKWWKKGTPNYFEPEQYAAMLSACYDGHEGRLGPGYGVKGADPTMQVLMAGLTNFDTTYLKRMIVWCKNNRQDHRFPADVVNFHHYCNEHGGLFEGFTVGVAPETDRLYEKLSATTAFSQRHLPGKPVWLTETGYDTDSSSVQRAQIYGPYSRVQVQGVWVLRTYLEAMRAGVSVVDVYNLIDEHRPEAGLFQSSGLATGEPDGMRPKQSWKIVSDFITALDDARLKADLSTPGLRLLYFEGSRRKFFIAWLAAPGAAKLEMSGPGGKITVTEVPQFIELK